MLRSIVDLDPTDPALGLALEEVLLESTRNTAVDTLRMWINKPSVIIGRSQSVSSEVDLQQLRELSIPVIRRISGGGAVYHYEGNLNVSVFLEDGRALGTVPEAYATIGEAIVAALSNYAIDARVEGNIIMVGKEKIAGAAQARRGRSLLYHMSLLVFPSRFPLERLLLAMQASYAPMLVPSHARPVTSLSKLSPGIDMKSIAKSVSEELAKLLGEDLKQGAYTGEEMEMARRLRALKYATDEWNLSR